MALADKHFCKACGAAFNVFFHDSESSVKFCPNCGFTVASDSEPRRSAGKDVNINIYIHDERKETR